MWMLMARSVAQGASTTGRRNTTGSTANAADESLQALQKLLENKEATTSEIKNQVIKVRKAKEKSQQELATAQKELRELLTVRQEAILISRGLLD